MHGREKRAARNENLFRRLNERLHALAGVTEGTPATTPREPGLEWLVCECARRSCSRVIELTPAEYASVRAGTSRFAVFPDASHTTPEVEAVVERHARYWVVQKHGEAADEARALADEPSPL